MKEKYFESRTIKQQSIQLLADIQAAAVPKRLELSFENSALLVLDMQEFFLDENSHAFIPSAKAIIPGIKKLTALFDKANRPIIFTKHVNTESDAGMMSKRWRDIITGDNPLSEITSQLNTDKGIIIPKSQYDSFYNTELNDVLIANKVTQLIITGVMTHLCCETTARSGFVHGYEIFFPVDGTATYNLNFHRSSLYNLAHGFAEIVTVNDILKSQNR